MKILCSIHLYPPRHNCGGEYYIHNLNKYLVSQGHEVRVILHQAKMHKVPVPYEYEGVSIMDWTGSLDQLRWADIILTHLDYTHWTILMCQMVNIPVIQLVHNSTPYNSILNAQGPVSVCYNSGWIADELNYNRHSMVLHPPCDYRKYDIGKNPINNEFITLININRNKGGRILERLAQAMPEKKFLAVVGSYDEQVIPDLPNVFVVPNTRNILPIYENTRILLMLSQYESWGMTATEAMCNGIPVIATKTPGLVENLSYAGMYVPARKIEINPQTLSYIDDSEEYDLAPIIKQINKLENQYFYEAVSERSRERSRELDPLKELEQFNSFLYEAKQNSLYQFQ